MTSRRAGSITKLNARVDAAMRRLDQCDARLTAARERGDLAELDAASVAFDRAWHAAKERLIEFRSASDSESL